MKKVSILLTILCFSVGLHASECGFYIFGGGGVSTSSNAQHSSTVKAGDAEIPFDGVSIASNLTGGANGGVGYNFIPCLGVQGNFVYWGEQDYAAFTELGFINTLHVAKARTCSYGVEAIGYLPLCCDTLNFFVKVGYARYHVKEKLRSSVGFPTVEDLDRSGNGLSFGAGLTFAFNRCVDVQLQTQALYQDTHSNLDVNITLYQTSVGLIYHFGL